MKYLSMIWKVLLGIAALFGARAILSGRKVIPSVTEEDLKRAEVKGQVEQSIKEIDKRLAEIRTQKEKEASNDPQAIEDYHNKPRK